MAKKQPWKWDETILVLDAYLSGAKETDKDPRVAELADLLPHPLGSIVLLLRNFHYLDPEKTGGAPKHSDLTRRVWDEFADDRQRVRSITRKIRKVAQGSQESESMAYCAEAPEGRYVTQLHRLRERNRGLIIQKKKRELKKTGRLACEACGFEFLQGYGERGKGFIECHHKRPVSDLEPGTRTRLGDLALLCSNCHRMIHVRQPWVTVDELRELCKRRVRRSS